MFHNSAISKTKQWGKVIAAATLAVFGVTTMFAGILTLTGNRPTLSFIVMLGGMTLTALGFAFACLSIRCPKCEARWAWLGVKEQRAALWLEWLVSQARCPVCKHTW